MSSSFLLIHTYTNQEFCEQDQEPEKLALIHFEALVLLLELAFIVPERIPFFTVKLMTGNTSPSGQDINKSGWPVKSSMLLCCVNCSAHYRWWPQSPRMQEHVFSCQGPADTHGGTEWERLHAAKGRKFIKRFLFSFTLWPK